MESFSFTLLVCCRKRMEYFSHKLWLLLWVKAQLTNNPLRKKENEFNERKQKGNSTVSFIWIWLILMRNSLCLKSLLKLNRSPSSTSLPRGFLLRTRAFPHARDCSVRLSSPSSARDEIKKDDVKQEVRQPWQKTCNSHEQRGNLCQ